MKITSVYLMRHGQCQGGQILRGTTDVALSAQGQALMLDNIAKLVDKLAMQSQQLNACFSSPRQRCMSVAKQLNSRYGLAYQQCDGLAEIDFGEWDGQPLDELYQSCQPQLEAYWQDPWANPAPNGETMAAFEMRVQTGFEHIANQCRGQHILLLTHGGVIRHLMAQALGVSRASGFYSQLDIPYGAVVNITLYQGEDGQMHYRLHWPNG
ncbi:histidine phosphatase family protein [Shewanella sp. Scap07]|uniref:histidine phosphatase family protein n=1 Tax=Shewanella sp. Scap07 TaxID=2589987 RepID=UPI0015BA5100|nr:histidine phosphatase family protein [Shewanella sp. Scap07]QLE86730.1 histidine phosphatase family protein [Shewanella sp. Scap07]